MKKERAVNGYHVALCLLISVAGFFLFLAAAGISLKEIVCLLSSLSC